MGARKGSIGTEVLRGAAPSAQCVRTLCISNTSAAFCTMLPAEAAGQVVVGFHTLICGSVALWLCAESFFNGQSLPQRGRVSWRECVSTSAKLGCGVRTAGSAGLSGGPGLARSAIGRAVYRWARVSMGSVSGRRPACPARRAPMRMQRRGQSALGRSKWRPRLRRVIGEPGVRRVRRPPGGG